MLVIRRAADGTLVAGSDRGVFRFNRDSMKWLPAGGVTEQKLVPVAIKGKAAAVKNDNSDLNLRVNAIEVAGQKWYVATASGLLMSGDGGQTWQRPELPG